MSTLKKLYVVMKTQEARQIDATKFKDDIGAMLKREKPPNVRELYLPKYLECAITGQLMEDPVTIESGVTFEKSAIEEQFRYRQKHIDEAIAEDESEDEKPVNNKEFVCPVTMQKVDPEVMIPNVSIAIASKNFVKQNPWAYEYNPRQNYRSIKLWTEAD